jgi:Mrp family chromosome partitioning ATPase
LLRDAIDQAVEQRRAVGDDDAASVDLAQRINRLQAAYGRGGDPTLRLLEPATAPGSKVGLGPGLIIAIVIFCGLGFGVLVVLVLDSLRPRLTDADELERVTGLSVLARVPRPRRRPHAAAERDAFDALRAELEERLDGGTVVVVSAIARDGRTAATAGLLRALTGAGHAVAAVDAHVSRPRLAARLKGEVSVLEAGDGTAVADLIAEAREQADFVVVDTAPFSENSDALALTHVADATILVARAGHTGLAALRQLCALLDRAGGEAIGAVLMGRDGIPQVLQAHRSPVDVGER